MSDAERTDEERQDEETQEETKEETQTSAPSVDDLTEQIEQLRKAQSGSDRKVKELQAELKKAREEKDSTEETYQEKVDRLLKEQQEATERQNRVEQENIMLNLLSGTDYPRDLAMKYVGATQEKTEEGFEQLKKLMADRDEARDKATLENVRKRFSRNVEDTPEDSEGPGYTLAQLQDRSFVTKEMKKGNREKIMSAYSYYRRRGEINYQPATGGQQG